MSLGWSAGLGRIFHSSYVHSFRALSGLRLQLVNIGSERLAYADNGGSGPPLLLLHGLTGDHTVWLQAARHLAKRFRLLIPDLGGHGASPFDRRADYSVRAHASRVLGLLNALGIEGVCIAGNSMGAWAACELTTLSPGLVISLVLISPAGLAGPRESWLDKRVRSGNVPFLATSKRDYEEFFDAIMVRPPPMTWSIRAHLFAHHRARLARFRRLYECYVQSASPKALLEKIDVPVQLLWGVDDRVIDVSACSEWVRALKRTKARVEQWRNVGHMAMLERPFETARLINNFIVETSKESSLQ